MMVMYYFGRLDSQRFNYWNSVFLLLLLTFFYARKDWKSYTKRNLWLLFMVDSIIAILYHYVIRHNPINEYTNYMLTEIWIRPTIIYGLVACFVSGKEEHHDHTP